MSVFDRQPTARERALAATNPGPSHVVEDSVSQRSREAHSVFIYGRW